LKGVLAAARKKRDETNRHYAGGKHWIGAKDGSLYLRKNPSTKREGEGKTFPARKRPKKEFLRSRAVGKGSPQARARSTKEKSSPPRKSDADGGGGKD